MKRRGLTLLEIIIATVIMALITTGLANIFIAAKRHILHARSRMAGGELGKYFIDPLQMEVREDTWDQPQPNNNLTEAYNYMGESQTINSVEYKPTYTITNSSDSLRKVKVEIGWNETK
jgi:prepilin-type N-terminal cleavage/methylation domain-containing protein